jgi:hypothetical protein
MFPSATAPGFGEDRALTKRYRRSCTQALEAGTTVEPRDLAAAGSEDEVLAGDDGLRARHQLEGLAKDRGSVVFTSRPYTPVSVVTTTQGSTPELVETRTRLTERILSTDSARDAVQARSPLPGRMSETSLRELSARTPSWSTPTARSECPLGIGTMVCQTIEQPSSKAAFGPTR